MVSKSTKSIASRIPIDLYFQIQNEANELGLNMKDYLLQIIISRKKVKSLSKVEPSAPTEKKLKKKSESKPDIQMDIFGNAL